MVENHKLRQLFVYVPYCILKQNTVAPLNQASAPTGYLVFDVGMRQLRMTADYTVHYYHQYIWCLKLYIT